MKIFKKIKLKIVIFTAVKNRSMLHGRVFLMPNCQTGWMDKLLNLGKRQQNLEDWEKLS